MLTAISTGKGHPSFVVSYYPSLAKQQSRHSFFFAITMIYPAFDKLAQALMFMRPSESNDLLPLTRETTKHAVDQVLRERYENRHPRGGVRTSEFNIRSLLAVAYRRSHQPKSEGSRVKIQCRREGVDESIQIKVNASTNITTRYFEANHPPQAPHLNQSHSPRSVANMLGKGVAAGSTHVARRGRGSTLALKI
jgi:hypothetical protein